VLKKLLWIILWAPLAAWGQGKSPGIPEGFFHTDSIKLGELVNFSFYYRHPTSEEVILPDSTYNFCPL
jgi:hypothetical protein